MPHAQSHVPDGFPIVAPGVYEMPWRTEDGARAFAAIGIDGELLALRAGDRVPTSLLRAFERAMHGLGVEGEVERRQMRPTPKLARGVHVAPYRRGGEMVYVAIDSEGRCRAQERVSGPTIEEDTARLWAALGDLRAQRLLAQRERPVIPLRP